MADAQVTPAMATAMRVLKVCMDSILVYLIYNRIYIL